jgi:ABC-type Mn2+/Zn2+ transport system permease subunit
MMALACGFGVLSTVGGLYASYELHASSGATIVLLATLIFFIALAVNAVRRPRRAL